MSNRQIMAHNKCKDFTHQRVLAKNYLSLNNEIVTFQIVSMTIKYIKFNENLKLKKNIRK